MRYPLLMLLLLPTLVLAEPLRVFVSVSPIQTFVGKIGGRHVDVRVMVQPGYSPATYDPTPQQISALAQAALYVRVGVPFEHAWLDRLRAANPAMQLLDARSGLRLRPAGTGHDHDHGQHHDDADPHIWTSPQMVRQMAGRIRDALAGLDPAHAADYAHNHAAFVAELDALDREIRALLDPLPERSFLVFHPAWGYFADAYGLVQVPIEQQGKQPGARTLARLIGQARAAGIRVVFVQPQFDSRQAQQVAEAIGGRVIAVDPLAPDYADNLRRVARQFAEALRT